MIRHQLALFFALTFALGWGVPLGALIAARVFGFDLPGFWPFKPFGYLVSWSPALAACGVIAITRGPGGLGAFVRRLTQWRAGAGWYVLALVGIPIACVLASLMASPGEPLAFVRAGAWQALALDAVLRATTGPISELGWRGYAQPMLQRRCGGIEAPVLIGGMWALWLLPAFVFGPSFAGPAGPPFDLQLAAFVVRAIALSVILGVVYNRTGGSVPVCMLVHWTASLAYPGEGTGGALPAQAFVLTVVAITLAATSRSALLNDGPERHVTRLPGVEA